MPGGLTCEATRWKWRSGTRRCQPCWSCRLGGRWKNGYSIITESTEERACSGTPGLLRDSGAGTVPVCQPRVPAPCASAVFTQLMPDPEQTRQRFSNPLLPGAHLDGAGDVQTLLHARDLQLQHLQVLAAQRDGTGGAADPAGRGSGLAWGQSGLAWGQSELVWGHTVTEPSRPLLPPGAVPDLRLPSATAAGMGRGDRAKKAKPGVPQGAATPGGLVPA